MLLLELLSRLQNSNTSLLFWNLFTGVKFLNELNIKSSLTKFSIPLSLRIYMTLYLFSLLTVTTHALLCTLCHSHQTIIITQSHSSILPTCFTSSLEPAPYITHNSSSELLIPLSATFIWTCWFNLLYTLLSPSITFSLFHSELKTYLFRKSYPPP